MDQVITVKSETVLEMERIVIDTQVSTAKAYPRTMSQVRENVLTLATVDQKTATACHYAKPVGGKHIVGPSIRLAEIIVATYGNLRCKAYLVAENHDNVVVRAECWDLESNSAAAVEHTRAILDKHGNRYPKHLVNTTIQAAYSIAYRNAVFKIVPMSLFKEQEDQIKLVSAGSGKTLQQQAGDCWKAFEGVNFNQAEFLQVANLRRLDDITVDDIITLRSLYTSLLDGMITKAELLNRTESSSVVADAAKGATAAKKTEEKKPEEKKDGELTPEQKSEIVEAEEKQTRSVL